jgi:hypothetical protein
MKLKYLKIIYFIKLYLMKLIKKFDYLGTKPELLINGQSRVKSLFGGVLSILLSSCLLLGTVYFINILYSREIYSVSQSDEFSLETYSNWDPREMSFYMVNKMGEDFPEPDRTFGVSILWFYYQVFNQNGKNVPSLKTIPVKMEKCDLDKHFKNSKELWSKEPSINLMYCTVPDQNFNITKPYGYNNFTSMSVYFHRCLNTTQKNNCLPKEDIDKLLLNAKGSIKFKNYYFNHLNSQNVGVPYIFTQAIPASVSIYRKGYLSLKNVQYETDDGLILPESKIENYVTYDNYRETVDFRQEVLVPGSLVGVNIDMASLRQNIKKNYYKLQNMLADLGGLFKALITIATYINYYFCEKLYYREIMQGNIDSLLTDEQKNTFCDNKKYSNTSTINIKSTDIKFISESKLDLNNLGVVNKSSFDGVNNINKNEKPILNIEKKKIIINQSNPINPIVIPHLNLRNILEKKRKKSSFMSNPKILQKEKQFSDHGNDIPTNNFNFGILELIYPSFCFRKKSFSREKLKTYFLITKMIRMELDVVNIFRKLSIQDMLLLLYFDEDKKTIIENSINPKFYNYFISNYENLNTKNLTNLSQKGNSECEPEDNRLNDKNILPSKFLEIRKQFFSSLKEKINKE